MVEGSTESEDNLEMGCDGYLSDKNKGPEEVVREDYGVEDPYDPKAVEQAELEDKEQFRTYDPPSPRDENPNWEKE